MSVRTRNRPGPSAYSTRAGGVRPALTRAAVAAGLFALAAGAQSPIEQLTIGPLKLQKSVFADLTGSTNVDGTSKEAAREAGVEREDLYMTYGIRFGISGRIYPDIDLNFSTNLSKERHFIRTDLNDDGDIPFLGDANFDFNRSRGRLRYGISLQHSASTEEEKQKVFVPAARREQSVREVEQVTTFGTTLGWTYERLSLNSTYSNSRTRFNEEFADGDDNEQSFALSANYQLNRIFSLSASHNLDNTEQVGQPGSPETGWERTSTVHLNANLMQRPSFTYSVGAEREEEGDRKGEWDPTHTFNLSDFRNIGSNVRLNASATYSLEEAPEAEDISFVYNLSLTHQMPHGITQSLLLSREPVETFGSTTDSDQTTYSYSLNKSQLFILNLSASLTLTREETKPKFSDGSMGPMEVSDDLIFNLNWTGAKRPARWLSLRRDYQYIYTDSSDQGKYDEHRLTLGVEMTL